MKQAIIKVSLHVSYHQPARSIKLSIVGWISYEEYYYVRTNERTSGLLDGWYLILSSIHARYYCFHYERSKVHTMKVFNRFKYSTFVFNIRSFYILYHTTSYICISMWYVLKKWGSYDFEWQQMMIHVKW